MQKVLVILVTNIWPEQVASTVKEVKKRVRSTMKIAFLNELYHISVNGPTSDSKEAKAVVTRAVESIICLDNTTNQINHML